jgi:FkbM family methyltransferase
MLGDVTELKWNNRDLENCKTVVRRYCGPSQRSVVVQAGGCYGVFAKWLSGYFEFVYTFEPAPALFNTLVFNVQEHNVIKLQAALGIDRRLITPVCTLPPGKPILHPGMTHTESNEQSFVPTIRIDDLGLRDCDLIYLDIEGDEFAALCGARKVLTNLRPVIVCEINSALERKGFTRYDLFAYLRELDYAHADSFHSDEVFISR